MSADSFPDPDHKVAMSADSFPDPDPDHEHDSLYYDRSAVPVCPDWVILEPFVFRRDDEESFPADLEAPVRASGKTSWEAPFKVAFSFAKPPRISRLYAQLPGFPGPDEQIPLAILGSHHNLALFRVATDDPKLCMLQDFFIYSANASSLVRLPPCTGPEPDYTGLRRSRRSRQGASTKRRLLTVRSVGLLCPDDGKQEFVVAELKLFKRSCIEVHADVRYLKSAADNGDKLGCTWKFDRVPIHCRDNSDIWQLYCWQTDAVVPMGNCLGWIDYYRGILLCDFCEDDPKVSFVRLPLDKFPDTNIRSIACSWLYRGVSYTRSGEVQFIDVARNDGIGFGALKPGSGFTITSHVLHIQSTMVWDKISTVTSDALWSDNPPERLPREVLMFPQVDINNPHLVHFLLSEFRYAFKNMWVVTIDFQTKTLKSSFRYINGSTGTVDADLTKYRSCRPMPFLSCELSKYIRLKRKRLEVSSVILPD